MSFRIVTISTGTRYMVVDCGGGTVDITVHEVEDQFGTLKELHKATGGACGSVNIDKAFEELLVDIFGQPYIDEYKVIATRPLFFTRLYKQMTTNPQIVVFVDLQKSRFRATIT